MAERDGKVVERDREAIIGLEANESEAVQFTWTADGPVTCRIERVDD